MQVKITVAADFFHQICIVHEGLLVLLLIAGEDIVVYSMSLHFPHELTHVARVFCLGQKFLKRFLQGVEDVVFQVHDFVLIKSDK